MEEKKLTDEKTLEFDDDVVDLLVEFDEMGFAPTTTCPDPDEYAKEWKSKLIYAIGQLCKETAEKFAERLKEEAENRYLGSYMDLSSPEYIEKEDFLQIIDEIAKEITEGE